MGQTLASSVVQSNLLFCPPGSLKPSKGWFPPRPQPAAKGETERVELKVRECTRRNPGRVWSLV